MLPNIEELYKPYSKDADFKTSLLYWKKEARNLSISDEVMQSCIAETFLEMANGKTFPTDRCDCGCNFPKKWSCVALNHYVLKKMIKKKGDIDQSTADILQNNIKASMLSLIEKENQEYIRENTQTRMERFKKWIGLQS